MEEVIDWVITNKNWLFSGIGIVVITWMGRLIFKKIYASSTQTIRSGDSSINVQAARNINIVTKKLKNDVEKR